MSNTRNMEIATTILQQLGGKMFSLMTGAKDFLALDNGLRFKICRNSAGVNTVTVEYDVGSDTYNMIFEAVSVSRKTFEMKRRLVNRTEDVHCGELCDVFTRITGLHMEMVRFTTAL